jgi:GTP 3',8-cyclase
MLLHDKFGRAITDLRISITDRCNYKCVYCRTGNEGALYGDLPFADYLRMARVLVGMGVTKIRLTGGEPLLRNGVVEFVRELAKLRPQGLKPASFMGGNGTAEAVPFPSLRVSTGLEAAASQLLCGNESEERQCEK